jgi:hypothetical protein
LESKCQPGPTGMIEQTVGELLDEKVVLDVEGIDRLYLNDYLPMLQTGGGGLFLPEASWEPGTLDEADGADELGLRRVDPYLCRDSRHRAGAFCQAAEQGRGDTGAVEDLIYPRKRSSTSV